MLICVVGSTTISTLHPQRVEVQHQSSQISQRSALSCDHLLQSWRWPMLRLSCIPKEEQAKRKVVNEALVNSSGRGHLIAVRDMLEKHKANVNYVNDKGFTALYNASAADYPEVIEVLTAAGARVDWARSHCGFTVLGAASHFGKLQAVSSLIRASTDHNQVMADDLASSPLMAAAHRGHALIIDALAAAGARVDYARPKDGATALYLASQEGQLDAVSSLIRARADPNQVMIDEWASSPLMIAAFKGHALVIDALAAAGAHVDYIRPKDGVTALHLASQEGQLQAVRSLLLAGADPRLAAHDGTTALDDAKRNKHNDIVALLEARLAELAASP